MRRVLVVLGLLAVVAGPAARAAPLAASAPPVARPAATNSRIGIFEDQLANPLSAGLLRFAATHYAGAQKLPAAQTDALKRINPRFFVIQYRLALGLGYRATTGSCSPTGDWIRILYGDAWIREWPRR